MQKFPHFKIPASQIAAVPVALTNLARSSAAPEIPELPAAPEIPDLEFVDLTVAQVKAMSDSELLSILSGESEHQGIVPLSMQQLITSELLARTLINTTKPHWSVVPSFWLLVLATLLALVAAVAAVLALPQSSAISKDSQPAPVTTPVNAPMETRR